MSIWHFSNTDAFVSAVIEKMKVLNVKVIKT